MPRVKTLKRNPDFLYHLWARFLAMASHQILAVAISQYVFERTKDPLHLGYVGLSLFLPKLLFALPAGHLADRFYRRSVILVCRSLQSVALIAVFAYVLFPGFPIWTLYVLLFLMGMANTFDGPANQALVPDLVPVDLFEKAVALNSSVMQLAFVIGPAVGGLGYALAKGPQGILGAVVVMRLCSLFLVSKIKPQEQRRITDSMSWTTTLEGLRYIWRTKVLLGTISLDLFAVLLGGAVALMPVFANEILGVGAWGLGFLRAAPPLGAVVVALVLARRPPMQNAGMTMLSGVFLFGVFTILFALSRNFYLSLFFLFCLGAADMVSVVIRGVLVQAKTPPEMRGRVSAVNLIFIGASNELGEFESGVAARVLGTVPSVIVGGLGTLLVVLAWSRLFPDLKGFKKLT